MINPETFISAFYAFNFFLPPLMLGKREAETVFKCHPELDTCHYVRASEIYPDLFERVNDLRDNIYIYRSDELDIMGTAYGTYFGPHSAIVINTDFAEALDDDAFNFVCKHELAHLYFNDAFKINFLITLAMFVTSYVLFRLSFTLPVWSCPALFFLNWMLIPPIHYIVGHLVGYVVERRADDFAITYSTDAELIGGRRFLQAGDEDSQELVDTFNRQFPNRIELLAELSGDFKHGLDASRVKKIEDEMRKRKIDIHALDLDPEYILAKEAIKQYYRKCKYKSTWKEVKKLLEDEGINQREIAFVHDSLYQPHS